MTTPYDADIEALTLDIRTPSLAAPLRITAVQRRAVLMERREGYLRALADVQPRIDALVAALGRIAAGELGPNAGEFGPDLAASYQAQQIACAALKAAGKE